MINTSSIPTDQRISAPDMSRLSTSSAAAVVPKLDKLKQWSRQTYKCTKQSIYERLGRTTRTVDIELDTQIEALKEIKRRYENILALARSYANHFFNLMQTQRAFSKLNLSFLRIFNFLLGDQFLELKRKSFLLSDEFGYNAQTQRLLVENGEVLFNALNYFISTLNTLCTKTMEDTMNTIRSYETSRSAHNPILDFIGEIFLDLNMMHVEPNCNFYQQLHNYMKNKMNWKNIKKNMNNINVVLV
jgi:hypothetical protein